MQRVLRPRIWGQGAKGKGFSGGLWSSRRTKYPKGRFEGGGGLGVAHIRRGAKGFSPPRVKGRLYMEAHRLAPSPSAEQRPKAAAHRWAAPSARRFGCRGRLAWVSFGHCQHKPFSPTVRSPHRGPALRGVSFCSVTGEGVDIRGLVMDGASLGPCAPRAESRAKPAAHRWAAPRHSDLAAAGA